MNRSCPGARPAVAGSRPMILGALIGAATSACANEVKRPADWSEETHGKSAAPNYELLFDTSRVHSIEITIAPSDYAAMQADLAALLGDRAVPGGGGAGVPEGVPAAFAGAFAPDAGAPGFPAGGFPGGGQPPGRGGGLPDGGVVGGGPPGGGGVGFFDQDPIYVPVEVRHEGHVWTRVGMRYKGNSSLVSSSDTGKLPFRFDFDEFEDQFPEINDQRFHGFGELTFGSNWSDDSLLRECFATELFRDRGIPAARCAFYRVSVDVGEGPEYWGLYSMVEDPSDPAMLESQLGGTGGNLYKPEGAGADWVSFDREGFVKKTNDDQPDWSDIEGAIAALHADRSDAAAWRSRLESLFDVDRFLHWLAINTSMVNWDSYGSIAHNYYVYGSPSVGGLLQWIPWDHNLSLQNGGFGPATPTSVTADVLHESVGEAWPLISILLADPVYMGAYRGYLARSIEGLFAEDAAAARLRQMHELIAPSVVGPDGETSAHTTLSSEAAFNDSVDGETGLIQHLATRRARVSEALAP
jgi:spore coat protein H